MEDVIQLQDKFYILASSSTADDRTRVLKQGHTFGVFDRHGDIRFGQQGLFHNGTRHAARLELKVGDARPMLLSSTVVNDNGLLAVDLTNLDVFENGELVVPRGTVHIFRAIFIWEGVCYERVRLWNYGDRPVSLALSFVLASDFADVFEVRGMQRARRGETRAPAIEPNALVFDYTGLDGNNRSTRVTSSPAPQEISESALRYRIRLDPARDATICLSAICASTDASNAAMSHEEAAIRAETDRKRLQSQECEIYTSNDQFNDWLTRSGADLRMMITQMPEGPYPFAGVPWFSAVFGRDGVITAFSYLWVNPNVARGVLAFLAAHQATEKIPEIDAEPGKILHEMRRGEMAQLKEIPFGLYYGSVDSTPLFIILAGYYYERTGDRPFIQSLWPNIERALQWIDEYGDVDGDGFVEYARRSPSGLVNQGWKDSNNSVFHSDGAQAQEPIALCEVQAYVYEARLRAADLAGALGLTKKALDLRQQAREIQVEFDRAFWCEDIGTYALALDGRKRPCRVRSSNAGHALFSGIASPERAKKLSQTLLKEDSFSGWGIRTISSTEALYNPMSYHNGSVWPHDNAMIAFGFNRYGLKEQAIHLLTGFFDASALFETRRLPELFCGFHRRPGEGPTLYPVACSPQAWASASVYLLLQACLGLSIKAAENKILFENPMLPDFFDEVHIQNLRVGEATVDLFLHRRGRDVGVHITRREGNVKVVVTK